MLPSAALQILRGGDGIVGNQKQPELERGADREDDDGRDEAGEIFSDQQNLAADRGEQVVVQAFVDQFAAEQIHEDAHASEKDGETKEEELKDGGEDELI